MGAVVGAGEQWTGWRMHFHDVSFTRTLKLSVHVKIFVYT